MLFVLLLVMSCFNIVIVSCVMCFVSVFFFFFTVFCIYEGFHTFLTDKNKTNKNKPILNK